VRQQIRRPLRLDIDALDQHRPPIDQAASPDQVHRRAQRQAHGLGDPVLGFDRGGRQSLSPRLAALFRHIGHEAGPAGWIIGHGFGRDVPATAIAAEDHPLGLQLEQGFADRAARYAQTILKLAFRRQFGAWLQRAAMDLAGDMIAGHQIAAPIARRRFGR